jgi:hypothetical protein
MYIKLVFIVIPQHQGVRVKSVLLRIRIVCSSGDLALETPNFKRVGLVQYHHLINM